MSKVTTERGMTKEKRKFDLEERLIAFAVRVIAVCDALPKTRVGTHLAGQLVRCGTSPAHNYGEAQSAESREDFVHKSKICLKELRETRICLLIILNACLISPRSKLEPLLDEAYQLIAIFMKSIETAKRNTNRPTS